MDKNASHINIYLIALFYNDTHWNLFLYFKHDTVIRLKHNYIKKTEKIIFVITFWGTFNTEDNPREINKCVLINKYRENIDSLIAKFTYKIGRVME